MNINKLTLVSTLLAFMCSGMLMNISLQMSVEEAFWRCMFHVFIVIFTACAVDMFVGEEE